MCVSRLTQHTFLKTSSQYLIIQQCSSSMLVWNNIRKCMKVNFKDTKTNCCVESRDLKTQKQGLQNWHYITLKWPFLFGPLSWVRLLQSVYIWSLSALCVNYLTLWCSSLSKLPTAFGFFHYFKKKNSVNDGKYSVNVTPASMLLSGF